MHRLDWLLRLLAVGTIATSVAALAASEWWLLELTSHFRLQYLAIQTGLLILLLMRGRRLWSLALLPLMTSNLIPLAPYWLGPASDEPLPGEPLTIMNANLRNENTDYPRFMSLLESESPDILLMVEFNAGWSAATRRLHADYPYRIEIPRDDRYGIALFSRRPFMDQSPLQLQTTNAIDMRISLAGRSVRVLGVHLRSPTSAAWSAERNRQLSQLVAIARQEPGPLVVVGDFNISPYSPIFMAALPPTGLRDSGRARGLNFSWPTSVPLLGIPIDLCMISEHFAVLDHRRGPAFGSDHYPMTSTLVLK